MDSGQASSMTRSGFAIAMATTALIVIPAYAASVDWVQTYNNYGHTGENAKETNLSTANVSSLQLKWARSFGAEVRAFVLNDHYVIARVPNDDGQNLDLWYLNYTTGETVWKISTGPDVPAANGTLATGEHRIFSECGLVDKVGYKYSGICAYRKDTGHLAWFFSNPCNCTPEANVVTPLLYANGIVFFGYFNGGSEGKEYAIAADSVSGKIIGTYQAGGINSLTGAPYVKGGRNIFVGCGSYVCALSHKDGSLRWKSDMGAQIGALSADTAGHAYVNLCNGPTGLVALDGDTGAPVWTYGDAECNRLPAAISGDRVYFTAADAKVHALDAATAAELWSAAPGTASSPSLANGVMYVSGGTGAPATSAYDMGTGALLWSDPVHTSSNAPPPVIIDGKLYVANQACGSLCAYGLPDHPAHRQPKA